MDMKNSRRGGYAGLGITIVIAIAVVLLAVALLGGGISLPFAMQQQDSNEAVLKTSDTTPTLTFACVDKYQKGTTVDCDAWAYKRNGGSNVLSDPDNAIEVDCGDKIEALVNGSNYYSEKIVIDSVECVENPTVDVELVNYDTAPDLQWYDQDDGLLNTATNTEALAANCQDTQTIKLYPSYHDGLKGAHFFVDIDGDNIDKITSSLGVDVGKPKSMAHNSSSGIADGASTDADEMYVFEIGDVGDQAIETWTITIDCGGTAVGTANATMGLIDQDWYVSHDGSFRYGFQDDDNADVAQLHHLFDEPVWTAST